MLTTEKSYEDLRQILSRTPYIDFSSKYLERCEKINPFIKKLVALMRKYDFYVDGYENIPEGPVIYASSHQDFNDVTNSICAYKEHVLTLNAINIRKILKLIIEVNGAIFIDREDKESRFNSKTELIKALCKGKSINMYPEATLNCTPSKLHLPFYIGIIDIAQKSGSPIIPVVQEYTYDETYMDGKSHIKSVHVRFGKPIYVDIHDDRIEKLEEFDELFSTIRWELWEEKGNFYRDNITNQLYIDFIKARIRDWRIPNNSIVEERKKIYDENNDFYLFHHINDIEYDEDDNLLPTEYVRKLNKIHNQHFYSGENI